MKESITVNFKWVWTKKKERKSYDRDVWPMTNNRRQKTNRKRWWNKKMFLHNSTLSALKNITNMNRSRKKYDVESDQTKRQQKKNEGHLTPIKREVENEAGWL